MVLTESKYENLITMLSSEENFDMAINVVKNIDKGCFYKKIIKYLLLKDSVKSCGVNYVVMQSGPKIYFNNAEEAEFFTDQFLIKEIRLWKKKVLK